MLFFAFIECIILSYYLYQFYLALSDKENNINKTLTFPILKSRFFNWMNEITNVFFSGRFLTPFFAMQFGLQQASIFKIVSNIIYCITYIMKKAFESTSSAFFSHTKKATLTDKKNVFMHINNQFFHVIIGLLIFTSINYQKMSYFFVSHEIPWAIILLYFCSIDWYKKTY